MNQYILPRHSIRPSCIFSWFDAEHYVFPKFAIKRERKKKISFFLFLFFEFVFVFLTISITRNTFSMLNSETGILHALFHCNLGLSIISTIVQVKTKT